MNIVSRVLGVTGLALLGIVVGCSDGTKPELSSDLERTAENSSIPEVFAPETIHFAFDSSELSYEAKSSLDRLVAYLQTQPQLNLVIEGHCDSRGSTEYNMALGARRAEAVKMLLLQMGVSQERMSTISYGKERPLDLGLDEASWAKNRRAEFQLR